MKQIISIIFIAIVTLLNLSCSNQDEPTDKLAGTYWSYQKPHFEFEYATDTIVFQMMQKQIKIGVKQLKGMFTAIAQEKMGAYFKGINFQDHQNLVLDIQNKQQIPFKIPAQYMCDENYLQLTVNLGNMLSGMNFPMNGIPPISFKYHIESNQLTMYFEKVYIQVIYSIMSDSIVSMIIKAMGVDFSHAPEGMEEKAKQAIQKQINDIFQQTQRLEFGFVLGIK